MKVIKNNTISTEVFSSVNEFVSVISKRNSNKAFAEAGVKDSENNSEYFCGTSSFEEAQKLLKSGYKEGMKDLLNCKTTVKVISPARKTSIFPDVTGFAPIVPNAIIGIPQSMLNRRIQQRPARVINILLNVSLSGSTSKDVLIRGGKNLYNFIKSIEATGIKVNLSIMAPLYMSFNKKFACPIIKIKDSKQAINPQLISYPLLHPSFFRRHIFKWIETSEFTNFKRLTRGYGQPAGYYMARKSGSVLRFLQENNIAFKDTFYIDITKASYAKDIKDFKDILGVN